MTTTVRRHSLALLGLLLVASIAHAEATWVLWGQAMDPWGALMRFSLGAWPVREACETERARKELELAAPLVSYVCLSDTAEPPATKGT